jgi:hypothetical protein
MAGFGAAALTPQAAIGRRTLVTMKKDLGRPEIVVTGRSP